MACLISVDDEDWPEVGNINSYAIFMGYLLMGTRGLGLLVLTWTTVVLLGGFVSMLQTKDFWCLTVITLVQTAGIFDFLLKEKASDIGISLQGFVLALMAALFRAFRMDDKGTPDSKWAARVVLAIVFLVVTLVVQLLVLALVLSVVAVLYGLGLYVSAGISLWRLIEHDYGSNAEGGANLKPALNVLYSIALAQGVVFGYKTIYDYGAKSGLVEEVASKYSSMDTAVVSDYLDETVTGCMKDTSFARGRNLVTYAVDLLMEESKSRDGYLSGVRVLGTILQSTNSRTAGQPVLIEQLLTGSASFSHVIQRLVETFGPRSAYSGEIREHAAMIVANVAGSIRLEEQFPGGTTMIQCVSSLLDTLEEYKWRPEGYERHDDLPKEYERDWLLDRKEIRYLHFHVMARQEKKNKTRSADVKTQESDSHGYKGLVVQGLRILQKLAANEDNCRVIRNTEGLLPKTIVPLTTDELHSSHDKRSSIAAEESLELMKRLMATGETETKLPGEVSRNSQAIISSLEKILECHRCEVMLKRQAVEVLLDLSVDTPSVMSCGNSRKIFVWILLHIFLLPENFFDRMCGSTRLAKKSSDIRKLAGEKLKAMLSSQSEATATSMNPGLEQLHPVVEVIGSLTGTVVDAENNACRLHAIGILDDLCYNYYKDDELRKELKKHIADVMPKVLKEIIGFRRWTIAESIHAKTEANKHQASAQRTDIEISVLPQGGQADASSSQGIRNKVARVASERGAERSKKKLLHSLSLTGPVCHPYISLGKEKTFSDFSVASDDSLSLLYVSTSDRAGDVADHWSRPQQQSGDEQHDDIKLQEALISLCSSILWRWGCEFDGLVKETFSELWIWEHVKNLKSLVSYAQDHLEQQKKAEGLATED